MPWPGTDSAALAASGSPVSGASGRDVFIGLLLGPADVCLEVIGADPDGVGDTEVGEGAARAKAVDGDRPDAEPVGDLRDGQQGCREEADRTRDP